MGKALYRTYRSKNLSEIIGQEHITATLAQALKQGQISHAYLFTGPRGVGKTSIARIWAHEINNIPYEDDSMHLDIIEIDAASNRRIDEIRDLRDKVHIAPTSAKYKVYIIDEVHMLTREAFNALLKTLEEPPAHAVFILATTDAHKLPETIISRTQRYTFRPVEQAKVIAHLRTIADAEQITISDEALQLLAEHGEGSFRDSISMLDQARSQSAAVEVSDIQNMLGIAPRQAIETLVSTLASGAASAEVMQQLEALYTQGYQAASIAKQIGEVLRAQLVQGNGAASRQNLELLTALIDVPTAHNPERFLEISLLEVSAIDAPVPAVAPAPIAEAAVAPPAAPQKAPEKAVVDTPPTPKPAPAPVDKPQTPPTEAETVPVEPAKPAEKPTTKAPAAAKTGSAAFNESLWPQILDALKKKYNTLYGVIRMAHPVFGDDNTLQLHFTFAFHQKRINEAGNRKLVTNIIKELSGEDVALECLFSKEKPATPAVKAAVVALEESPPVADKPAAEPAKTEKPELNAISNIFGGAELLES